MGSRVDSGLTGSAGIDITMASTVNGGSVTLNDMTQLLVFQDQVMYFELLWDTTPPGRSYSRNFTVLPTERQEDAQRLAEQAPYNADLPAFTEVPGGSSNPAGSVVPSLGGGSPPTITPVPLIPPSTQTSAAAGSATAVEPMGNPTSSPQATSHSSSSGLSTGAIAGIAVAAALVGLGLLATLIFCLVRRRRRDRLAGDSAISPGGRYGSRATPELIAQKEANASVGVEVSPHSPYSDDGGGVLAGGLRHGSAARQHQEEVPLAPGYADGPAAVSHRRSVVAEDGGSLRGSQTGRSLTPGRATPTAVRHLVEEGMTEDEIRRLEEEERELDQAIEQAGSGGRR
ncbi:hypothetical protein NKR19_g6387 [Coniochaeta hoffmannii]|uniref:Mid2 domain-containing protein n=1 Tax=Coniochaeta hoffmannii TaxID=91930 RepID=A0AA38RS91_9PEZI|nr:hypothetical protein NKR19_g6387 [Coniochaeta hoffmannii]